MAPHVSAVIAKIIRETFPENEIAVFEGGVELANDLLTLPVDHIFFTGSIPVGRAIMRAASEKGSDVNAMLKLALNGVYGDTNNIHSPFYDPLYTMRVTINGQLLLCLLAEWLMKIPNLQIIQIKNALLHLIYRLLGRLRSPAGIG